MPLAAVAFFLVATSQTSPQIPHHLLWETDKLSKTEYRQRRELIKQQIGAGKVAMVFTNPERNRSNDTDFPFRPNSNFWYLTGFEEPDAALLLAPSGLEVDGKRVTEIIFVNDRDENAETWTGWRVGPGATSESFGIELALSNRRFAEVLKKVAPESRVNTRPPGGATGTLGRMVQSYQSWATGTASGDVIGQIERLRPVKSPEELRLMRKAVNFTLEGHREALKSAEPGIWEYEIRALVEYVFAKNGCESVAYGSIVGAGENSCILHYPSSRKRFETGEIVCMDVAGEYHGYAADVTRSYPVNGKFSPAQKEIYELVLAAQEAGIAQCKPGNNFNAPDAAAREVIAAGLVKLGIIKDAKESGRYFMHGTSHTVGLDVHDPWIGKLEPNVVLTVEPGIYIKAGSPCDKKYWNIGVRIEDDILVTTAGPVNMSGALPRKVSEIEKLMKLRGIGNQKLAELRPFLKRANQAHISSKHNHEPVAG